jgi:hypothetical protein
MDGFDVTYLPFVPFVEERLGAHQVPLEFKGISLPLPQASGIYFVLEDATVLYVGRAIDLKSRWQFHHLLPELRSRTRERLRIAYDCCPEAELEERELAFIKLYQPILHRPHAIRHAVNPAPFIPPYLSRKQIGLLGKDTKEAKGELDVYGPCTAHGQQYIQGVRVSVECVHTPIRLLAVRVIDLAVVLQRTIIGFGKRLDEQHQVFGGIPCIHQHGLKR